MIKQVIEKPEVNFWVGLLIPIIGVAVSWGVLTTKVNNIDEKVNYRHDLYLISEQECNDKLSKQDTVLLDIQVRLAEIQKDIIFIKTSLK